MATSRFFGAAAVPNTAHRASIQFGERKAGVPPSNEGEGGERDGPSKSSVADLAAHHSPLHTVTCGTPAVTIVDQPSAMVEQPAGRKGGPKRPRILPNCNDQQRNGNPAATAAICCNSLPAAVPVTARVTPTPRVAVVETLSQSLSVVLPGSEVPLVSAPPPSDTATDLPMPDPSTPDGCHFTPGARGAPAFSADSDVRLAASGRELSMSTTMALARAKSPRGPRGASHFFGKAEPDSAKLLSSFKDRRSLDCMICLNPLRSEREGIGELPCNHQFCFGCVSEWLKVSAPPPVPLSPPTHKCVGVPAHPPARLACNRWPGHTCGMP